MVGESSSHVTTGSRRLAAIMCADIVGFSRLMGKDEEGTHERMKRYRRDIIEPTVSEHYGQIFKHTGDGFLAIFDSPLEAVRCAIVIQQTVAARNAAIAKDRWLQYRIGINLGDVIVEPDDIYGDGVNVAARLQTTSEPGGVNISGGVYEQVKNKLVCGYQSLGDERLKNITDPVRVYKVLPDPAAIGRARPAKSILALGAVAIVMTAAAFLGGIWFSGRFNPPPPTAAAFLPPAPAPATIASAPPPVQPAPAPPPSGTMPSSAARDTVPGLPDTPAPPPPLPSTLTQGAAPPAPSTPTQGASPGPPSTLTQGSAPPPAPAPESQVAAVIPPANLQAQRPASNVFRDCERCPEMVRLPGGTFSMGSHEDPSEQPVHQVTIAPFAIGRLPVTIGEWKLCVAAKACKYEPQGGEDDLPVANLSWDDAQQFVTWLSQRTSKPYRLPTEAEWEYAARGGTSTPYWWGSQVVPGVANCRTCGDPFDPAKPIKIGLLRPNPFGLHDMAGGIAEWVADCWHNNYQGAPRSGSQPWDAPNCREYVLRGGSWRSDPGDLRVASRARYDKVVRYPAHGFRVALTER
jgi:formylglycine-generating enzyme required for sulfatase activity/class 3 adenylate cyclase